MYPSQLLGSVRKNTPMWDKFFKKEAKSWRYRYERFGWACCLHLMPVQFVQYNICFLNDPTLIVLSSTNSKYCYLCIPSNFHVSCAVVEMLQFLHRPRPLQYIFSVRNKNLVTLYLCPFLLSIFFSRQYLQLSSETWKCLFNSPP